MNSPKISIIIVTYNPGSILKEAIESSIKQNYKDFEIVIIDGGSTDCTIDIIKSYGNKINYFISEKDNGIYDAMNKGIKASKGEWILFLGADDKLYSPDILKRIFENTLIENFDFIYGDVLFLSNKKRYSPPKNFDQLTERNICHQGIFYKKKIFDKIGNYNTKYPFLADYDLNLRIFKDESIRKEYVNNIITLYNNKGVSNNTLDSAFYADMLLLFKNRDGIGFFSPVLQQFHFYFGYIELFGRVKLRGIFHLFASWVSGKRKLFYWIMTAKLIIYSFTKKRLKIK